VSKDVDMTLEVSIRDEKAELFLELITELKSSMVEQFRVIAPSVESDKAGTWDEAELVRRIHDVREGKITPLTREEVFDSVL
jgi:hypothetical protein